MHFMLVYCFFFFSLIAFFFFNMSLYIHGFNLNVVGTT